MYIENKHCYRLSDRLSWMLHVEYFTNISWLKYTFTNDLSILANTCIYVIQNILVLGCKNPEVCDLNLRYCYEIRVNHTTHYESQLGFFVDVIESVDFHYSSDIMYTNGAPQCSMQSTNKAMTMQLQNI